MTSLFRVLVLCGLAALVHASVVAAADPSPGEYRVVDGKVDDGTYRGWMTYYLACQSCHGTSDRPGVAPDLTKSLRSMTRNEFVSKVRTRYRVNLSLAESLLSERVREAMLEEMARQDRAAKDGVAMPAWQSDETISQRVLDLHAYLKARADGAIGPGRPKTMGE
jgi:hypothetical protein